MAQYIYTMIGVSKTVPPNRTIIRDISLSFFPGAKIGLLGLNGAGKSTVLRIMAGADPDFEGEARPQPGIRIGYLPQEPELDESKSVREIVEEGVAETRELLQRFDEISMKFAEPMDDDAMNTLLREQAELQEAIERPTAGNWNAPWKWPRMPCAFPAGTPASHTCPAANARAWRCAGCCCPARTCCCWTNRPIISMLSPSAGWSAS